MAIAPSAFVEELAVTSAPAAPDRSAAVPALMGRGDSYLIEEGLKSSEFDVVSKGWAIVDKNQDKISNLVMDMLSFSKEREPEMVPADINEEVEQGRVTVRTQFAADEHMLRIFVEDNGAGIAPDDLTKIFSVFESRKGSRGTGLGLPVSQKIMHEHEGDIVVESTPGQGSRFCLSMPAVLAAPADTSPSSSEARTTSVPDQPAPP